MNNIYQNLNDKQQEAVFYTKGPLLILAGAGSGKTRVLMHRIAYLIENGVSPFNIMAITFTNKAAASMRERLVEVVGDIEASQVWAATFHSTCVRILRRFIDRIGYENDFGIYDGDDQRTLIKKVIKKLSISDKMFKPKDILSFISTCKNELRTPFQALSEAIDVRENNLAKAYKEYQSELKKNNSLDFDDLILKTIELFEKFPDVLEFYQERFIYIMVDEYQDTNTAQFRLIELLARKYKNLCVVGDDDQSIYKFRGANITNILNFEAIYPQAKVIRLEQNYRSRGNILAAANEVIKNNKGRKGKTLWTDKESGEKVRLWQFNSANEEADAIIKDIRDTADNDYSSYAVLYRTNAQSRLLEERCISLNIPYQLVGGVNFYQRKEIKDIIAYLKIIASGRDDVAFERIINIPKRGIGDTSISKLSAFATEHGISLYEAAALSYQIDNMRKASEKLINFHKAIVKCRSLLENGTGVSGLIEYILEDMAYKDYIMLEGEIEGQTRLENIAELMNKANDYDSGSLDVFLEEVALISDIDKLDENKKRVTLMTLHAAKGLEFPYVYIAGMEEGLFPSEMTISGFSREEMEEERRLCYVGITRAMLRLTLTSAKTRMVNGQTKYAYISRFVNEIPDELLEKRLIDRKSYVNQRAIDPFGDGLPWNKFNERPRAASRFEAPKEKLTFGKEFKIEKPNSLEFEVGDKVSHIKFGSGEIIEIEEIDDDYRVAVDFEKFGVKRMSLAFAKLKKV